MERVEYIAEMMRNLEWGRSHTYRTLAESWGLAPSSVREYASEASRVVAREVTDPATVNQTVCTLLGDQLLKAYEDAEAFRGTREGLTARDQIGRLGRTWADIAGSIPPSQLIVHDDSMTPAKAREIIEARFGKVTPKEKPQSED